MPTWPQRQYLIMQFAWLPGGGKSIYLDVMESFTDRTRAEEYADANGGFLVEADWWPRQDDPRRQEVSVRDQEAL